jgi:DNA-directed RNA polymerase specialized sigma24 family protein
MQTFMNQPPSPPFVAHGEPPRPMDIPILALRGTGHTYAQIAARLGGDELTVARAVRRARRLLLEDTG